MNPQHRKLLETPLPELQAQADELNRSFHGNRVTYVINRNANFTNICTIGCTFCGFARKAADADAYQHTPEDILHRLSQTPQISEVCIQGGIHPGYTFQHYLHLISTIKQQLPHIHIHAFSPMEIQAMSQSSGKPVEDILLSLRDHGLGSIPGTAAEILVDEVRRILSKNKLTSAQWQTIIRTAHRIGLPSTATIMYGHIETWEHIFQHLDILRHIQLDTGGFTEIVPLSFIPHKNKLGHTLAKKEHTTPSEIARAAEAKAHTLYPIARLHLGALFPNLQTSWVKLGPQMAAQSLHWGCNDFGGTLYEESITTASGGTHGQALEPAQMEALIRSAGKTPATRNTLYQPSPHTNSTNWQENKNNPNSKIFIAT